MAEITKEQIKGFDADVTNNTVVNINQVGHGLIVGDVIRLDGVNYVKAQANTADNAEVIGMVSTVTDVDNLTIIQTGYITGLSGLTANSQYFLDPTTAGAMTLTNTTTVGEISKPLIFTDSTTSGWLGIYRGVEIVAGVADGDSAYTVAVNNGFVGTEPQWLATLVGAPAFEGTGTVLALDNKVGSYYNMAAANAALVYTTSGTVLGSFACTLINATSEPTVTGATKIKGNDFVVSTDMHLWVQYFGVTVQYWFAEL